MPHLSFAQARVRLQERELAETSRGCRTIEMLERTILGHAPQSVTEAVCMLDVVIPELRAGGRSDGRDIAALGRIRALLATL